MDWWFRAEHVGNIYLYVVLSVIFWYAIVRMVIGWINLLAIKKPEELNPESLYGNKEKKVAIFTTSSPGEPLSMFEKTLAACAKINYPHTTYLLDDTQDPRFRDLAHKHGAVWLELVGIPGAKAGKINKALELTDEEFILVLDPDHIPFPEFLDNVLGYFEDEGIGFVQVSQAYYNQYRSFTAKAAAEQTYTFYGPTMMGMNGLGTSVAIGANCTFRRKALESIKGHGIGLAEDLITAIRMHAAGWKSVYNPVVVSRGLVPEDFGSFCKQQLKWSRGVHEVLFSEIPGLFKRLSFWQRISYSMIGTYYLTGTTSLLYVLFPFLFFWFTISPANMYFSEFILNGLPIALVGTAIYLYTQKWLCHPSVERGIHWRGTFLKFACYPVYFFGFLLSVLNSDIPYIPTAKQAVTGKVSPYVLPLLLHLGIFIISVVYVFVQRRYYMPESELVLTSEETWGMLAFSTLSLLFILGGLYAAWEAKYLNREDPWEHISEEFYNEVPE